MKKVLAIFAIAIIAVTCVFAAFDSSKLSVGVSTGISNETVETFGKNTYLYLHTGHYGFDMAVRGDYNLNEDVTLTAIIDWSMPHWVRFYGRTDFFARNTKAVVVKGDIEHKLALTVGATKSYALGGKFGLDLTAGPEFKICLNDGKIDLGLRGIAKVNYGLSEKIDLNLSVGGTYYFLIDGDWFYINDDRYSAYMFRSGVTAGLTYKF